MNDQEAYEKGLERLGLTAFKQYKPMGLGTDPRQWPREWADLRTDPAFAWWVLEACFKRDPNISAAVNVEDYPTVADALYAAVIALGREE